MIHYFSNYSSDFVYAARFGKSGADMGFNIRVLIDNLEVSFKHSQAQQWSCILLEIVKFPKLYLFQVLSHFGGG